MLVLLMRLGQMKDKIEALKSFNRASVFKNTKEHAKWWIEQIQAESENRDS